MSTMPDIIYPPLPFDFESYDDVMKYHEDMQAARKQALETPLKAHLILPLKLVCKAKSLPMSRPLPWFAGKEGTYECELLRLLQEGPDKYSQVWIARVKPVDGTPVDEGSEIVLKIIQPSLNFIPHPDYDWSETYINPEQLAVNEDQTYSLFKHIQGIYVPYYYGMQKMTTPSGESAWVLAMEYIDGDHVEKFVDNLHKTFKEENVELLGSVYRSMTNAMRAIVDTDVKLCDVHARNFIVIRGTVFVVAVDFANIQYGYYAEDKSWGINMVGQSFIDSFRRYKYMVMDWDNKNIAEDMRGYYKRNVPKDLDPEDAEIIPV